jgi:Flp pilus assembly protein TadD
LLPTLNPFGLSWLVAERYIYYGITGIFFVICYYIHLLLEKKRFEAIGWVIFILIVMGLMVRTIMRNIDWKNEDSLWIATGKYSPSDPKTHNNLGDLYARQGNYEMAVKEFQWAIQLNPQYSEAYHNLANVVGNAGNLDEAIKIYGKALSLNPNQWQTHHNLALVLFSQKEYEKAIISMENAAKLNSQDTMVWTNLGIMYIQVNKKNEAKQVFLKALQVDPNNMQAKKGLMEVDQ